MGLHRSVYLFSLITAANASLSYATSHEIYIYLWQETYTDIKKDV